jgi:hypothetical protein
MYITRIKGKPKTGTYKELINLINQSGLIGYKIEKL